LTVESDGMCQITITSCANVMDTWHSIIRHTFSIMELLQSGLVTNTTENPNCRFRRHCLQHNSHCNHQWNAAKRRTDNRHDSEGIEISILKSVTHFKNTVVWRKSKAFRFVSSCYFIESITKIFINLLFLEKNYEFLLTDTVITDTLKSERPSIHNHELFSINCRHEVYS